MRAKSTMLIKTRRLELLACLGLFCLLVPLTILSMWISAFNLGFDHPSRIKIFLDHFPAYLGLLDITLIQIVFCIAAIVISYKCLRLSGIGWKSLNLAIIIVSALLILLQIWGLM
jgi:hypothetical protein